MTYTITFKNSAKTIQAHSEKTILTSALEQGMNYPYNCMAGNCGACKSQLLTGSITTQPYAKSALRSKEAEAGLFLACRAQPQSDCEIQPLAELTIDHIPSQQFKGRVMNITPLANDTVSIQIHLEDDAVMDFAAGQYAKLKFADLPAREYSMANRPDEKVLEFFIQRVGDGIVSSHINERLHIWDKVDISGPYGTAHLRKQHQGPIIAIAGGSGIAPIKSIVEQALLQNPQREIHLYFGVRSEQNLYLENHFKSLAKQYKNFRFIPVLSAAKGWTRRRTGYITVALQRDFSNLQNYKAYLAGSPTMVDACVTQLQILGLAQDDCHADAFYTQADNAKLETAA